MKRHHKRAAYFAGWAIFIGALGLLGSDTGLNDTGKCFFWAMLILAGLELVSGDAK